MGMIADTFLGLGCIAAGYALCYYTHNNPVETKLGETKHYDSSSLSKVVEKYADLKNTGPIVGSPELGIEYVVSKKDEFKGYVFTEKDSGKKGILIKSKIAGNNQYSYVSLERSIENVDEHINLVGCAHEDTSKKVIDKIKKVIE